MEVCYQVVGRGTALMTQLREGERLDVLGPLGNGFWKVEGRQRAILVGGGIGVAPLLPWAEDCRERGKRRRNPKSPEESPEVLFLIGGKSRDKILGIGELKKIGCEPHLATEDGSLGMQGVATDLLERELMTQGSMPTVPVCLRADAHAGQSRPDRRSVRSALPGTHGSADGLRGGGLPRMCGKSQRRCAGKGFG